MKVWILALFIAALLVSSIFGYFYVTKYSPPFSQRWVSNAGHSDIGVTEGGVVMDGNYYFIGMFGDLSHYNTSLKIEAFNLSTGNREWTLPFQISYMGWDFASFGGERSGGNIPRIFAFDHFLYLVSYFNGYAIRNTSGNVRGISVLDSKINASNGEVLWTRTLGYSLASAATALDIYANGNVVYSGDQAAVNGTGPTNAQTTNLIAMNIANFTTIWNHNYTNQRNIVWTITTDYYESPRHLVLLTQYENNSWYLSSICTRNGTLVYRTLLHGFAYSIGVIEDKFVFGSSDGPNATFFVQNLSANTSIKIESPFKLSPGYPVEASLVPGELIICLNSSVFSYSPSGTLLWHNDLPYANSYNYGSAFFSYDKTHVVYYSLVSAFVNNGNGIDYMVNYEAVALVNLTNGHISAQRIYSPIKSLLNEQGAIYVPFMANDGSILYSYYSDGNLTLAEGVLNSL